MFVFVFLFMQYPYSKGNSMESLIRIFEAKFVKFV